MELLMNIESLDKMTAEVAKIQISNQFKTISDSLTQSRLKRFVHIIKTNFLETSPKNTANVRSNTIKNLHRILIKIEESERE